MKDFNNNFMKITKEKDKYYEVIKKPITLESVEDELKRLKDEKRNRGYEVYDEQIRQLEKKIKLMKDLK